MILHVVIDGASEMVHVQLRELLDDRRYHRLQVELGDASRPSTTRRKRTSPGCGPRRNGWWPRSDRELDELCDELTR